MQFSTLHEAIVFVLSKKQPLSFKEIELGIRHGNLWRRPSDNAFPQVKQIKDRSLYKYADLFKKIAPDKLTLNKPLEYPNKMTRLTYNEKGWIEPSGPKGKSHTKGLHESDHGFGHEEWLFDFDKTIEGYKYGFIEGFRTPNNKHGGNAYNLQLFTIDGLQKQKYWVAKIDNCYVLTDDETKEAQKIYKLKGWLAEKQQQLKDMGLWNKSNQNTLNIFKPNVRFLEKDVLLFDPPIPVINTQFINNRDRYLLYDWKNEDFVNINNVAEFTFKSSAPNTNKKVWRKNNPEFKSREIRQLHRKISEALYVKLTQKYGIKNIGCDLASSSGTYIDMVRKESEQYVLYEIKTYNQLRKNIREAIGQLLEYAYWKRNKKVKELVIVSDKTLDKETEAYLSHLKKTFKIPISYMEEAVIK